MSLFRVLMAGHVIEIETLYADTLAICRAFLTDGDPEYRILITQKDIDFEREITLNSSGEELPDWQLESTAVLRKMAECLLNEDVFLMHAAAIAVGRKAYLFTGKSGTGKSTHIGLWKDHLSQAYIVNGDKPFIRAGSTPVVYGSPWTGKEGVFSNTSVPLSAVVLMERAADNEIHRISFADAFPFLFQQTYRPKEEEGIRTTLRLLQTLDSSVAFYRFRFNNFADNCFDVAYHALAGDSR